MSRVFLSHSSADSREAAALKAWIEQAEPGLAGEIFLDLDRDTGIPAGVRWKEALRRANDRCEAVVCLLSRNWDVSHECKVEYRNAEDLNKPIFVVRLEPLTGRDITSEWQRCDLFGDGPMTIVTVDGEQPVRFCTEGLLRLRDGLRAAGIGADTFAWPPDDEPDRAPYRGWQPLQEVDAAVYFGRDAQIGRALNVLRELRSAEGGHLFVVLGPSGVGKSSFLRAGLLPRLRRDDLHFVPMGIVRPQRNALTGDGGLARSIHELRTGLGLTEPGLGAIKRGVRDVGLVRSWLAEAQRAVQWRSFGPAGAAEPTLVLPLDQAEELFTADAGEQAAALLEVLAGLLEADDALSLIVVATIRSDRYELLQTAAPLADVAVRPFDDLKPMPQAQFKEVICGPARRAGEAGSRLTLEPDLVDRLLEDWSRGADTLPLLSLTLARLYQDYGDGAITLAEYDAMGGLRQVVQSEVDDLLSADPAVRREQLDILRAAFVPWLATVNPDNDQPMRRVAHWSDLPPESHPLLEGFIARRLLVRDERDGEVVAEVALESLLRQWDALADWLRVEAGDLKDADNLERAARAWRDNDGGVEWLLPGSRLTDAESLAAKPGFRERLNPARDYLLASRRNEDDHLAEERRRHDADLQAARDREASAKALAEAETQAKEDAQRHASALRKRNWVLRAAVVLAIVAAVVAGFLNMRAMKAEERAKARARDAVANLLIAQSQVSLSGSLGVSNDVLGMQLALAVDSFPSDSGGDFAILNALRQESDILKIVETDLYQWDVDISPDGHRAITTAGPYLQMWDTQTWDTVGNFMKGHTDTVNAVAFSPDGKIVASGSSDGTIRFWDAESRQPLGEPLRGHEGAVLRLAFSRDGGRLVSGGADTSLRLWDVRRRAQIGGPMRGHTAEVFCVAFSPDGTLIASGGFDGTLRLWDAASRLPVAVLPSAHDPVVLGVAFSPDGRRLASVGGTTLRFWDVATRTPVGDPIAGHTAAIGRVVYSPDGTRVATASDDKTIRIWDAATGKPVGEPLVGHESAITDIAFDPTGGQRIVSTSVDDTMRVWDVRGEQVLRGHEDFVTGVDFSPDGRRIVSSGLDGTIRQWDTARGTETGPLLAPGGRALGGSAFADKLNKAVAAMFSSDGSQIIALGSDTRVAWDAVTGKPIPTGPPPPRGTVNMMYLQDVHKFVTLAGPEPGVGTLQSLEGNDVQVRDEAMRPIGPPLHHDEPVKSFSISADGHRIATASDDLKVRIWDADSGRLIGEPLDQKQTVQSVRFSSDGSTLAVGTLDSVRLIDATTGQRVREMFQDGWVLGATFSPDGKLVATGGTDGGVRLFDVQSGNQIGPPLMGHTMVVNDVDFSPDGTELASASADKTVRIWRVPTASREQLCDKLTHNMSRAEWNQWVSPDIPYRKTCDKLPIAGEG